MNEFLWKPFCLLFYVMESFHFNSLETCLTEMEQYKLGGWNIVSINKNLYEMMVKYGIVMTIYDAMCEVQTLDKQLENFKASLVVAILTPLVKLFGMNLVCSSSSSLSSSPGLFKFSIVNVNLGIVSIWKKKWHKNSNCSGDQQQSTQFYTYHKYIDTVTCQNVHQHNDDTQCVRIK